MARRYSIKLTETLEAYSGDNMGMNLGAACIKANLPMTYVARVFGVSRPTMDTWFNGNPIKTKYHRLVELLMMALKTDLEAGKLPAKTMKEAKLYISAMEPRPGELVPVSSI
jgi:hypothetical protein